MKINIAILLGITSYICFFGVYIGSQSGNKTLSMVFFLIGSASIGFMTGYTGAAETDLKEND